jgi:hypothetical protein
MAKHQFQTEIGQLLKLMTHSLYSNELYTPAVESPLLITFIQQLWLTQRQEQHF